MGLTSRTEKVTGSVPEELLQSGLLGRGIIVSVQQTSVSTGSDCDPSHVCVFTVEVALDNLAPYNATCRQAVRATVLPQLMLAGATVAVRVDAEDHSRIALSLGEAVPRVRTAGPGHPDAGPAGRILERGVPCQAVIVQSQALGLRSRTGRDMYAFVLSVLAEGHPPYQTQIGSPVPVEALPLIYPGNRVPARRMPGGADHELVIDWDAALGRAERAVA
jgi:hypothetical protein